MTGTIRNPDGSLATGPVYFQLVGERAVPVPVAFLTGSDQTIQGLSSVELVTGAYSVTLPSNDDITPAGTRWARRHAQSGQVVLHVKTTPATQREEDSLADPPASVASAALSTHIADLVAHGNGRHLWVARKTDATFATTSAAPVLVPGWSRSDVVPEGDWMVEASTEAFGNAATEGGTLGIWVDLAITAISRSGNVVTATLALGHGVQVGADVIADLSDNTFDGQFLVTASPVGGTTVQWAQTAANDLDGGTGTLSVRIGVNASFRNAGTVRAVAHIPDAWWAPVKGVAYTASPRLKSSVGTTTLLTGPFFGLPGQGLMTAETR